MDQQELDRYLHQVEDYEKLHYGEYQDFLIETGYAEADESERSRIRKEKEEEEWKEYQRIWDGNSVVLSYKPGEANQLVKPESRNMHETVLLSRSLVTEQDGIRKWMIIQKHPRFSVTFNHAHSFVEINYCYSGTVSNYINGHPCIMRPGDLVIMEPGCYHSIGLVGDDDILINFLLFPSAMATLMDKVIPGDIELSRFLLGALERGFGKNNYVSLRTSEDPRITETLNEIICEYTEEDRTASEAMTRALEDPAFHQCTVSWGYYLFRALEKSGLYERTETLWEPWRDMIRAHLTTCVESNGIKGRSDCHAWGALALYELPAVILGVRPVIPGFETVCVRSVPGYLTRAEGEVITPKGKIYVRWTKKEDGTLDLTVRAPEGMHIIQ